MSSGTPSADHSAKKPEWVANLQAIGRTLASVPNVSPGQPAPRLFLSVPTGQFVPWFLADGAFQAAPKLGPDPGIGERVTLVVGQKICDAELLENPSGGWLLEANHQKKMGTQRVPGVVLPLGAPKDRGDYELKRAARKDLKEQLSKIKTLKGVLPTVWYGNQSLSPVIVVGDGREYLHGQRTEILERVPQWLDPVSRILLDTTHGGTNDAGHLFHFPYMILAPEAARQHPWIASAAPRLVVYTRWDYFVRSQKFGLFATSPAVILGNRRVDSNYGGIDFIDPIRREPSEIGCGHVPSPAVPMYARWFEMDSMPDDDSNDEWDDL